MDVRKEIESMYNQIPAESRQQLNPKDLQYFFKITQILKQYVTDLQIKNTELYQKTAEYKQRLTETEDYCLKQNEVIKQHKMYAEIISKIKILLSLSTSSAEDLLYQKIKYILDIEQHCKEALYNQLIEIKNEISFIKKTIIIQKQNLQTQDQELEKQICDWLSAAGSKGKLTIIQCLSVIADLKNVMQHKINQFNQINQLNEEQIEKSQETIKKLTFQISEQQKKLENSSTSAEEPTLLRIGTKNNILSSSQKIKQLEALQVQNNILQMQRVELLNEINKLQNNNRKLEQTLALSYNVPQKISKDALVNYHTAEPYNKDSETQIQKDINGMLKFNNKVIFTLNAHEQIDKLKTEADAYKLQIVALQKEIAQYKAKLQKYKEQNRALSNASQTKSFSIIQRGRLENENMKLKKELNQYQKVINQQESQLADMTRSASINSKQIRQLSSQNMRATQVGKENDQLKLQREMLQEKNNSYVQQLNDALNQITEYKKLIQQLQDQNLQLNDQIIVAQSQKNNNLSNTAQIMEEKQGLYKEINSLNEIIIKKEYELKNLQTNNDNLREKMQDIQKQLDDTIKQQDNEKDLRNRNQCSLKKFKMILIVISSFLGVSVILIIVSILCYKHQKLKVLNYQQTFNYDIKQWKKKYEDAQQSIKQLKEQINMHLTNQPTKRFAGFYK